MIATKRKQTLSRLNAKITCAGGSSTDPEFFLQLPVPHTSQHHHSNRAILTLCPGPLQETPYCWASSQIFFFSNPQSLLPAPQPTQWACALSLSCLSVPFLMKNCLWLITAHSGMSLRVFQAILMPPLVLIKILKNKGKERIPWKNNLENTAYCNSHWEVHNPH